MAPFVVFMPRKKLRKTEYVLYLENVLQNHILLLHLPLLFAGKAFPPFQFLSGNGTNNPNSPDSEKVLNALPENAVV